MVPLRRQDGESAESVFELRGPKVCKDKYSGACTTDQSSESGKSGCGPLSSDAGFRVGVSCLESLELGLGCLCLG